MTMPILLTTEQTAEMLSLKPETLEIWRVKKRYNLPYVKTGRLVRYRLEDVKAFIENSIVQ